MRRTTWLVGVLALVFGSFVCAPIRSATVAHDVRVRPLDEGLWLVESESDWNGATIGANALILATSEMVLMVDTPWTSEQTGYLLDWIDREIGLPVRYLVVTHGHQDRIGGIAEAHQLGECARTRTGPDDGDSRSRRGRGRSVDRAHRAPVGSAREELVAVT